MEHVVPIDPSDVFWKVYAKELDLPSEKSTVIQLEWGWTAGMSEEELENYAKDAPEGKASVLTTLEMATELRDQLNEIISKHQG